jgi:sec-independent protein translocase protein TatA
MVMPRIGPLELAIILLIVVLVFGVGKLPELGSALGRGIRDFRKALSGEDERHNQTNV